MPIALPVYELPQPDAKTVAVCVVVRAPELDAQELAAWHVLGKVLLDGTANYTLEDLFRFGGQGGVPPRVATSADFMIVSVGAPAGNAGLEVALDVAANLITKPELREESITKWAAAPREQSTWDLALMPQSVDSRQITPRLVRDLYQRAMVPERIAWAAAGKFEPATFAPMVESSVDEWSKARRSVTSTPRALRWETRSSARTTSLELRSAFPGQSAADFATNLLAAVALGAGKSSSLYRVIREQKGWSYFQQAVLWPVRSGWQARLFTLGTLTGPPLERCSEIAALLQADIAAWSDNDMARFSSIAQACLEGEFIMNPIWLTPSGSLSGSVSDDAILLALSQGSLSRPAIRAAIPALRLDLVQDAARRMAAGQPFIIQASGQR